MSKITSASKVRKGDKVKVTITGTVETVETGVNTMFCSQIRGDDGATHFVFFNNHLDAEKLFDPEPGTVFSVGETGIWFVYEATPGRRELISRSGIIKSPEAFHSLYKTVGYRQVEKS